MYCETSLRWDFLPARSANLPFDLSRRLLSNVEISASSPEIFLLTNTGMSDNLIYGGGHLCV